MIKTLICALIIIVLTFDAISGNALFPIDKEKYDSETVTFIEIMIISCLTMLMM